MKNAIPILAVTASLFLFGESLQPAPRIEIYERVICRRYYARRHGAHDISYDDCKVAPVQEELAVLIGLERVSVVLPSILAIPFGALADHVGHNVILSLALFGVFLEESWPFLVCWFPDVFPIRLIWLHFVFSLIGGGTTVVVTLLHIIIAAVGTAEDRTGTFFRLRAAGVGASILGYAMAGILMKKNAWLPWAIGNLSIFLAAVVAISMPKTTAIQDVDSEDGPDAESSTWRHLFVAGLTLLNRTRALVAGNRRVMILLVSTLLCQLAGDCLALMMIIYISKRYGWSFADANMLNSVEMSVEIVFLLGVLPLITGFLSRRGLSAFSCNKYTAQGSVAALALGFACMGFAPVAIVAILGIVLIASGAGQDSLLRSLATDMVEASEVSIMYSAITVMRNAGGSISGPIYAGLYAAVLRLGGNWLGLPFFFAGILFVIICLFLAPMKDKAGYEEIPQEESDGISTRA